MISFNACLAKLRSVDAFERGVKNLLNFLGVIEGLRRSFLPLCSYIGGCGEGDEGGPDNGMS